ncbi:MAG: tRNA (adenosine(37)-N6)-threonylcarbamoyltransferase complex dimerization subunit type 1 TsaB [Candidatus Omnitrophota bacterium]
MNLLVLEGSSQNISISIVCNNKVVADYNRRMKSKAAYFVPYIDKYLKINSLSLKNFDAFVVGRGPGSFTGLRIAFSVAKAFSIALKKPLISIGSFFSMAYPFREKKNMIAVIGDARRGLIYAALFSSKNNSLILRKKEKLANLSEFVKDHRDCYFVTYDNQLLSQAASEFPGLEFSKRCVYPRAKYLVPFAMDCYNKQEFTPVDKLEPLYLHSKTCQIRKSNIKNQKSK